MRALLLLLSACQSVSTGVLSGSVVIDGDLDASGVLVRAVGKRSASTLTDAGGSYRFPSLPDGDYTLVFSAASTLEEEQVVRAQLSGGAVLAPEVRFTAVGSLSGQVTLAGQPGGGAAVFVQGGSAVAISGADGRYTLGKIAVGVIGVEAVLSGYRSGSLDGIAVARGQVASAPVLDLAREDGAPYALAALSGVARRIDRADSSGTLVTATRGTTSLTTTTASDGSYRFDGISTGVYRIDFAYDGHSEFIPQVLALAGSTGQVIDGALYPLESSPLDLPVARRLVQDAGLQLLVDDGRALVQPRSGGVIQLLSLTAGTLTLLADDVEDPSPLALAPDHSSLLYLAGAGQYYFGALRKVSLAGGPPSTLAPLSQWMEFTADGGQVVFQDGNERNLFSVPISGGDPVTLGAKVHAHSLHPDGKRVVYQSCDSACKLLQRSVDGGAVTELLTAEGPIHLAPDGAHVTALASWDNYLQKGQLWVAAVDGSFSAQLWDGTLRDWVGFSPDGRWLAFVTNQSELRLYDRKNGGAPTLVAQNVLAGATFAPDGRFFYRRDISMTSTLGTLAQQPAGGGTETVLGTRVDAYPQLSADGSRLLFRDQIDLALNTGRIRSADASGAVVTLADGALSAQLTADGANVHYLVPGAPHRSTIYTVPAKGGAPVKLADDAFLPTNSESPAGSRLAWYTTGGVVNLAPSAGGPVQIAGIGYPFWASDSRLVLTLMDAAPPYRHQNGIYVYEVAP